VIGVVICGLSLGFSAMALASAGANRDFPGWVAVFTRSDTPSSDHVQLSESNTQNVPLSDPMRYDVAVCGKGIFDGYLVLGEGARLEHLTVNATPGTTRLLSGSLTVAYEGSAAGNGTIPPYLAAVQVVQFRLDELPPCVPATAGGSFIGQAVNVSGRSLAGVSRNSRYGPFSSASQTWSMPYIGNLPLEGQFLGDYAFGGVLSGTFTRPPSEPVIASVWGLQFGQTITDARPDTDGSGDASWKSNQPIEPVAQVHSSDAAVRLQTVSAASGIGLGVFGSLLATVVYEVVAASGRLDLPVRAVPRGRPRLPRSASRSPGVRAFRHRVRSRRPD